MYLYMQSAAAARAAALHVATLLAVVAAAVAAYVRMAKCIAGSLNRIRAFFLLIRTRFASMYPFTGGRDPPVAQCGLKEMIVETLNKM